MFRAVGRGTQLLGFCLLLGALTLPACGESDTVRTTTVTETESNAPPLAPDRLTAAEARDFVRDHYRLVGRGSYDAAFSDFTSDVRSEVGPKSRYIDGYKATQSTDAHDIDTVLLSRDSARVSYRLSATARDACGDIIDQAYIGTWVVKQRSSGLVLDNPDIEQEPGETFVANSADCTATPRDTTATESTTTESTTSASCEPGYSDCLDPTSSDYDCASGSGDGPDYVSGPIAVTGSDRFGLDSDGDGVACES